jgi:8-oxo-dGTP diphosphatase
MNMRRPIVGVGVMILKDGKVLLAKRKGSHGEGEYAFPGGHLEFGESFVQCAVRETLEESGVEIKNVRFQYIANIMKYGGKQYVQVGLTAKWKAGNPQLLEPTKSGAWGWYRLNELPEPLFEMCRLAVISHKTGQDYFDLT